MYDSKSVKISRSTEHIFNLLLLCYPQKYRKRFGQEMFLVFIDLYQEELQKTGHIGIGFLLGQSSDLIKNGLLQQVDLVNNIGMKEYLTKELKLNIYNIAGFIFLLPAILILLTDLFSRIAQGDLTHYNRPVYHFLSHTPLYWYPILLTWVFLLPVSAVLVNLIPFIKTKIKNKRLTFFKLLRMNLISAILLAIGLGFVAIVKLHDFAPCTMHDLFIKGFSNLGLIISVCRNA